MSENQITLTDNAVKIVKADVAAFKRDGKRYADYIAEMNVTLDTVADHVAMFRNAYKAANKNATGDEIKAYATKVRNGLNHNLGKKSSKGGTSDKYVTAEGLKAESWDAFIVKARAEWDAANNQ